MEKKILIILIINSLIVLFVTIMLFKVFRKLRAFRQSFIENYDGQLEYKVITVPYRSLVKSIAAYSLVLIAGMTLIAVSIYLLMR